MKTTLLFSSVFLLTMASFAQSTVKNQETVKSVSKVQDDKGGSGKDINSSTAASTSTNIQSNAPAKAEQKVNTVSENEKKAVSAEKKEAIKNVKKDGKLAKDAAGQDHSGSVSANADDHVSAGTKNNKISEYSSLRGQASASAEDAKATGNQVKEEGKAAVNKTTATAETVKPKPAVIKMNSRMKTSSAIKIK